MECGDFTVLSVNCCYTAAASFWVGFVSCWFGLVEQEVVHWFVPCFRYTEDVQVIVQYVFVEDEAFVGDRAGVKQSQSHGAVCKAC